MFWSAEILLKTAIIWLLTRLLTRFFVISGLSWIILHLRWPISGHQSAAGDLEINVKSHSRLRRVLDFQRKSCDPPSPAAPLSGIKMLASCAGYTRIIAPLDSAAGLPPSRGRGYLLRQSRHHHPLNLLKPMNPMNLHTEGVSKGAAPSTYTLSRCAGIPPKGKQEVRRPEHSA